MSGLAGDLEGALQLGAGRMARTGDEMIVDHARGLHESIDGRRADEPEAFRLQGFRNALGNLRFSRGVGKALEFVLPGRSIQLRPDEM